MKFWIKVSDPHHTHTTMFSDANWHTSQIYWFMGTQGIQFTKPEIKFLPTGDKEHIILVEFDLHRDDAMKMKLRFDFFDVESRIR